MTTTQHWDICQSSGCSGAACRGVTRLLPPAAPPVSSPPARALHGSSRRRASAAANHSCQASCVHLPVVGMMQCLPACHRARAASNVWAGTTARSAAPPRRAAATTNLKSSAARHSPAVCHKTLCPANRSYTPAGAHTHTLGSPLLDHRRAAAQLSRPSQPTDHWQTAGRREARAPLVVAPPPPPAARRPQTSGRPAARSLLRQPCCFPLHHAPPFPLAVQ